MPFGYTKQPVKAVVSDVTGTRAIDGTIYQNTSGRPILVMVRLTCERKSGVGFAAYVIGYSKVSSPPDRAVDHCGFPIMDNEPDVGYHKIIFVVPNQYYYKIEKTEVGAGSAVALNTWFEVEL